MSETKPAIIVERCPQCGATLPPGEGRLKCPYCSSQLSRAAQRAEHPLEGEPASVFVPEFSVKQETRAASSTTRKIVIAGMMGAISIFLGATHLGFIPWLAGAALTIMHVPVIVGAVLEGPMVGLAIGFIFGAFSLLQGAIAPTGPTDVWFTNPLISILPRLFIGPMAWLVYSAIKRRNEPTALGAAAVLGSLTNTVLVLGALGLHRLLPWSLIATIAVTNGLPEAVVAAIVTLAVVAAWKRIESGRTGSTV